MAYVVVANIAQLKAALASPPQPPSEIRLEPGVYVVDTPLIVPDGVTLRPRRPVAMTLDADGLPDALAGAGLATLQADPALKGDIVTLHDTAALIRIRIVDVPGRATGSAGWGNPVAIVSRRQGDLIRATLRNCEIDNQLSPGVQPGIGPEGRGICVVTRTTGMAEATEPHAGATLQVLLRRTRVRAPNAGQGIFANNFAARGRIVVRIERCRIAGGLDAVGGTSRPHVVTGAQTIIISSGSHYVSENPGSWFGFLLHGGAVPPLAAFQPLHTSHNLLLVESTNDHIEGSVLGIRARAAGRFNASPGHGFTNGNRTILRLSGTRFSGITQSDLSLVAAAAGGDYPPGDDNVLTVALKGVQGSGMPAANYLNTLGATPGELPPHLSGGGNRLEILGDPGSFAADNPGITPVPPAAFFL